MDTLIFKNDSTEEFVGKWDGVKTVFKPGQEMYLEGWKALHYAKHWVDRELNNMNKPTSDQVLRDEIVKRCIIRPEEEVKTEEIIDKNAKKGKKSKKAEKEFEDLDQE